MKTNKISRAIVLLITFAIFVLTLSPAVSAITGRNGSITLNLKDSSGTPLANSSFRLYHIANAYESANGGLWYEFIPPYDEANIEIDDLQDSSLPIHLAYFAESHSLPFTEKATNENGVLIFDNLVPGLYLIVPAHNREDNYSSFPFVISIPRYNSENEAWEYDIDASPKITDVPIVETETYISVVKKWITDTEHPESITVILLRDFQEYDRIELNEENNWYHRWNNLPKNHIWDVVEMQVPDGYTVSYETSSNTVTIINKANDNGETTRPTTNPSDETTTKPGKDEDDKLVQTGQLNWPVPVFAIAGLIIFSIGWAILNLGKKESE